MRNRFDGDSLASLVPDNAYSSRVVMVKWAQWAEQLHGDMGCRVGKLLGMWAGEMRGPR
jgi:hypothetical protein